MISAIALSTFFLTTTVLFIGTGAARGAHAKTDPASKTAGYSEPTSHFHYRADSR